MEVHLRQSLRCFFSVPRVLFHSLALHSSAKAVSRIHMNEFDATNECQVANFSVVARYWLFTVLVRAFDVEEQPADDEIFSRLTC